MNKDEKKMMEKVFDKNKSFDENIEGIHAMF